MRYLSYGIDQNVPSQQCFEFMRIQSIDVAAAHNNRVVVFYSSLDLHTHLNINFG